MFILHKRCLVVPFYAHLIIFSPKLPINTAMNVLEKTIQFIQRVVLHIH